MMNIAGYSVRTNIYESHNSVITRATQESSGRPVIIKALPEEFPSPEKIARFKREFEMTSALEDDGVIETIALERVGNGLAIVIEDFGGRSLREHLAERSTTLAENLAVGVGVAGALVAVHAGRVMHKDIGPGNILWNPDTGQVKLIDFGISTELTRETPAVLNPNVLEGTLAYMSPEQTGRMNRKMDYRTDFYSLGATLYRLIVGRLPFVTNDPMELVHSHIAVVPQPPCEANPAVPPVVGRIIERLMAKDAEERYQSATAVRADLVRCLETLQPDGTIADFVIGQSDVSDRFAIPQKLYGRAAATKQLLDAFARASSGSIELMLVAGYSGIGKSALVHEVHKPIVQKRGYFISGKFDQFARNIPYASLIQAFTGLVRQLLTESEEQLGAWKAKLLDAVGVNGHVLVDVIPDLELIIGEQAAVAELPPVEAQNRFNLVFESFVRSVASVEHPLTIFLDDLQWADSPTLRLLKRIPADPDATHILLIGAYRDNEVDPTHPLMLTLGEIRDDGGSVETLTLSPLGEADVGQLVGDTLRRTPAEVAELTRICLSKTGGNPFFLNQFLRALYEEEAIDFDRAAGQWGWDAARIAATGITDNVVDLMARKIRTLSDETQGVLQLAACIGASFDLHTLSIVHCDTPTNTQAHLWGGLDAGLVVPIGDEYKFVEDGADSQQRIEYRWLHDRVQQAAYSLIDEDRRAGVHQTRYFSSAGTGRVSLMSSAPGRLPSLFRHGNCSRRCITCMRRRSNSPVRSQACGSLADSSWTVSELPLRSQV